MTLGEVLQVMNPDSVVAIGSKVAFIFIETVQEFLQDSSKIDKHCKEKIEYGIFKTRYEMEQIRFSTMFSPAEKEIAIKAREKSITRRQKQLEHYVPLIDRAVKDIYDKDLDEATAIIVTGSEVGDYWFKSEYDTKGRNRIND